MAEAAPLRIVVAEDDSRLAALIAEMLDGDDRFSVVGSARDGDEAVRLVEELQPDVVLMDYRMPGLNGAQATRAVLDACPATQVVCLTASVSRREEGELLAAGAVACLTKDEDLDVIVSTITGAGAHTT